MINLHAARKRRKAAQDASQFSDVAADLDPSFTWPSNSRFGVSSSITAAQGTIIVSIGAREIKNPPLSSGQIHKFDDIIEKGKTITVSSTLVGTITLYTLDQWMRPMIVGTRTFNGT